MHCSHGKAVRRWCPDGIGVESHFERSFTNPCLVRNENCNSKKPGTYTYTVHVYIFTTCRAYLDIYVLVFQRQRKVTMEKTLKIKTDITEEIAILNRTTWTSCCLRMSSPQPIKTRHTHNIPNRTCSLEALVVT